MSSKGAKKADAPAEVDVKQLIAKESKKQQLKFQIGCMKQSLKHRLQFMPIITQTFGPNGLINSNGNLAIVELADADYETLRENVLELESQLLALQEV